MPDPRGFPALRAALLTSLAMIAFAANSVLCRLALSDAAIDAAGFTAIRLLAGALILAPIVWWRRRAAIHCAGDWASGFLLFGYAACFSFAYVSLNAATGALVLFSSVQGTMIAHGLCAGDRPQRSEWSGWILAAAGLGYLLLPGIESPPWVGASLMATAGIAWGLYSVRGRGTSDALGATGGNFLRAVPCALVVSCVMLRQSHLTTEGVLWAVLSGAVTSGVGYVLWYAALPALTSMQAALVQLAVPVLAATGGVLLLAEPLTGRLTRAGCLILGGIAIALLGKTLGGRVLARPAPGGGTIRP